MGLLENVAAETEDRIGAIVAQVADAPGQILGGEKPMRMTGLEALVQPMNTTTEILIVANTFTILSKDLKTGRFKRHWTIQATGGSADQKGRLDLTLMGELPRMMPEAKCNPKGHNGILTRPITKKTLQVSVNSGTSV